MEAIVQPFSFKDNNFNILVFGFFEFWADLPYFSQ